MKGIIWITYDDDYKNCNDWYDNPKFYQSDEKIQLYIKYNMKWRIYDRFSTKKSHLIIKELDTLTSIDSLEEFKDKYFKGNYVHCKIGWMIFDVKTIEDDVPSDTIYTNPYNTNEYDETDDEI